METYELLLKPEEVKKIIQDYIYEKTGTRCILFTDGESYYTNEKPKKPNFYISQLGVINERFKYRDNIRIFESDIKDMIADIYSNSETKMEKCEFNYSEIRVDRSEYEQYLSEVKITLKTIKKESESVLRLSK